MLLPSWCFHTRLQHVFLKPRAWSSRKAGLLFGRYETAPHSRLTQTCPVDNCSNAWSSLASNVVYLLPQPHRWGFFCPVLTVIKAGGTPRRVNAAISASRKIAASASVGAPTSLLPFSPS
jgi:hypothetical protein